MGWTCSYTATEWKMVKDKNRFVSRRVVDRQKECDKMLNWTSKDKDGNVIAVYNVLKSAMVGSVYYAAVEKKKADGSRDVWAAIFKTCGRSSDGTIWGYKDMDETMGPYYYDCPAGILALLTPTDDDRANEWRQLCRKRIQEKAELRKKGPTPLYAPTGVKIWVEGKSWIISSPEHYAKTYYCGCRFSKARFHDADRAMRCFLYNYGTDAQKREFADSGRECPPEWKGLVA